ncbi:uncharacterized protein TNCV_4264341 [Trichonephila clavipes]|nr:uncharacterized protein TNCV_4264341 [Trichonephila clavipes]
MLRRRIAARPRPPATVRRLGGALLEEWNSIPQSLIDNFIASMANRNLSFNHLNIKDISNRRVHYDASMKRETILYAEKNLESWFGEKFPMIARVYPKQTDCKVSVDMLPWPVGSPDLYPIEHVWDIIGQQLQHHAQPALTVPILTQQAWNFISQSDISASV